MIAPHKAFYQAGQRSIIEEAKAKVSTLDLAEYLCLGKLRKAGKEWVVHCPIPDHEDRNPSFFVDPDKDVWFCHGCLRGGDVITLAQRAWDLDRPDVAAAEILLTLGHEIPPRPASWFAKQERQRPVRDAIEEAWVAHCQRRIYRGFLPAIEDIADSAEQREEARLFWDAAHRIAVLWRASIIKGRRSS